MSMRRADGVVIQTVDERAFLLDERGAEMIVLNPVGTMVWDALDGVTDADAIAASLLPRFEDVSLAELEGDVREFLAELAGLGLVVAVNQP
jgi:hypothetical protein